MKAKVPVGIRVEYEIYKKAMDEKERALQKGNSAAYSTQSWFSMLIDTGLKVIKNEQ